LQKQLAHEPRPTYAASAPANPRIFCKEAGCSRAERSTMVEEEQEAASAHPA